MTNRERINDMSNEELANEFVKGFTCDKCLERACLKSEEKCKKEFVRWLKSEVGLKERLLYDE